MLSILDYLYSNQNVFERFTDVYLPKAIEKCFANGDEERVEEIMECITRFAFIETTS